MNVNELITDLEREACAVMNAAEHTASKGEALLKALEQYRKIECCIMPADSPATTMQKARDYDKLLAGPNCYNCRLSDNCRFLPGPGEQIRFNCPLFAPEVDTK